jgi:glycolate oxidase iron-sulfur subunit
MAQGETTNPAGIFDDHNPPAAELYNKCVHCGFCLPTCPTYALWGEEMDSPRGRIYLMKLGSEGKARLTDSYARHFDQCLGCMACMTACPSGVQYGKLIEATRAQIERNYPRSWAERVRRRVGLAGLTSPKRLGLMRSLATVYQKSGVQALARGLGITKLLPQYLRSLESLMPEVRAAEKLPPVVPAQGAKRMRVGLVLGCVQDAFFSHVNAATARVLAAEGCEVVIPQPQPCCGALMIHAGVEQQALALARQMIDTFDQANVEAIVVNAAGCGSNVKDYGYLLRDDPQHSERAVNFSRRCRDVAELLAELEPRAERRPMPMKIAYHDACHLQHAQAVTAAPRKLLKQIPGVELLEVPEGAICCGSAGVYNLAQPGPAQELGDRKAHHVMSTSPDVVATGNPGCILQITAALRRAGSPLRVVHTVEVLDAAIRGAKL